MDKKSLLLTGAAVVTLTAFGAHHVCAATESVDVDATIVAAITLTEIDNLDFGVNSAGVGAGTVVVPAIAAPSRTGGVTDQGRDPDNAIVRVSATTGVPITLTVPAGPVTLTSGTVTMSVNNFNIRTDAGGLSETITLVGPTQDVPVGATLNVGGGQGIGVYNGAFTFNANYQ